MTRTKKIIKALDLFLAMYACVALLNYAHAKRFERPWVNEIREVNQSAQKTYRSTVDTYELMVAYSPNDATLRSKLGDAYYNLGQNEDDIAAYSEKVSPIDAEMEVKLKDLYYQKAAAAYKESLRLNPLDYETELRLGNLYLAMHQDKDAQDAFEVARLIAPSNVQVKNALEDFQKQKLYDRFVSERLNNPRSAYVAATEYLARSGTNNDEITRYLRRWVGEFEKRVPPENRPLQNPPSPNF